MTEYEAHRLKVAVDTPFAEFRRRYEAAVPEIDYDAVDALVNKHADWSEVVGLMDEWAPYGFLRYWSSDDGPLLRLAGDPGECVNYLMGNHVIAERMYRHDQDVMMYAPLRPVIASRDEGTHFTIEQPSAIFASFGDPNVAEVGVELDRKVATLLNHLDAPVPPALAR